MKMLFIVAILLAASAAAASAAPTKLADLQLDTITAGHLPVDPPPVHGHPWHPGGPPVFHPILFCFGGRCTSGH